MKLVLYVLTMSSLLACAALGNRTRPVNDKKDAICQFVNVWAVDNPELVNIKKLCDADASLKEIAAEYAGCKVGE